MAIVAANAVMYTGRRGSGNVGQFRSGVQSLTNVQKLSLAPATSVGTRANVTDGFSTGATPYEGFYAPSEFNLNTFPIYVLVSGNGGDGFTLASIVYWNNTAWAFATWTYGDIGSISDTFAADDGSEAFPWLANWEGQATLLNPAPQQLAAPSSAQGGVFLANSTQDGVYSISADLVHGKKFFYLVGAGDPTDYTVSAVAWYLDINGEFEIGPSAPGFVWRSASGDPIYYSVSDVATPDLATNWLNASDDSPAAITVTSVTQGLIDSGISKTGAGTAAANAPATKRGAANGRPYFVDVAQADAGATGAYATAWDGSIWAVLDVNGDPLYSSTDNVAHPSLVTTWSADLGDSPVVVVSRNDVAAEANWTAA